MSDPPFEADKKSWEGARGVQVLRSAALTGDARLEFFRLKCEWSARASRLSTYKARPFCLAFALLAGLHARLLSTFPSEVPRQGVAAHSMIIEIWGSSFARGAAALRQWARQRLATALWAICRRCSDLLPDVLVLVAAPLHEACARRAAASRQQGLKTIRPLGSYSY